MVIESVKSVILKVTSFLFPLISFVSNSNISPHIIAVPVSDVISLIFIGESSIFLPNI